MGQFGKEILSNQIPGWSTFYLDYKALKKVVSSLEASYGSSREAATGSLVPDHVLGRSSLDLQALPPDALAPLSSASSGLREDERGPVFEAHRAAFFFKLERELTKINAFYLKRELELKSRLTTLLAKRQDATSRLEYSLDEVRAKDGVELRAVAEGFRLLDKDLNKLQVFIDINATGFRKILKKWDKRSKSHTKELYLARQVEIQPCFDRQLLAELSDTVTSSLIELSEFSAASSQSGSHSPTSMTASDVVLSHQLLAQQRITPNLALRDLESNLANAITQGDDAAIRDVLDLASRLAAEPDGAVNVTRILWKTAIEAEPRIADVIMSSKGYDVHYVDDINGRTCAHGAAIAGELRLIDLCIKKGVDVSRADYYGRTPLHYACMNGHDEICQRLLDTGVDPRLLDKDNYTALIYAVINGHAKCLTRLLKDTRVSNGPSTDSDLDPLALACQSGQAEAALVLLRNGAQQLPNSNGQYPLHLAAREGHKDVCLTLLKEHGAGTKDIPDKYSEWTPLFHAGRFGHAEVVQVLIEAGCDPTLLDEIGHSAVFYAAWYGHYGCVDLLFSYTTAVASAHHHRKRSSTSSSLGKTPRLWQLSKVDHNPSDIDFIPSLSLPPPIMPLRIYGHDYLDNTYLVQLTFNRSSTVGLLSYAFSSAVRLTPRTPAIDISGFAANPGLKLVVAPKLDSMSPPCTIALPLENERETFFFRLDTLENMSFELSFYPAFGSKPVGRAVALSAAFMTNATSYHGTDVGNEGTTTITLPIVDHRLLVIGQISFEACVITPLPKRRSEAPHTLETYWKSTTNSAPAQSSLPATSRSMFGLVPSSRPQDHDLNASSSQTTPRPVEGSNNPGIPSPGPAGPIIQSSLSGEYICITVQVTRDHVPVVCHPYRLPFEGLDVGVADVSLEQFTAIARSHLKTPAPVTSRNSVGEWARYVNSSMTTLEALLQTLPMALGVCLNLAYPTDNIRRRFNLGRILPLNLFVDVVLEVFWNRSSSMPSATKAKLGPVSQRRKLVFTSSVPDVCVAVNWKQPNFAAFYTASDCGLAAEDRSNDPACSSLDWTIMFAKANNLLGIFVDASLLVRVPSLIAVIKESGLLLATFSRLTSLPSHSDASPLRSSLAKVDALIKDDVLSFSDRTTAKLDSQQD